MVGFLLQDDAVEGRRNVFDSWVDEQKRNAERAAQQAQQAAQATLQHAQQAPDQVAQRAQQFQDWVSQQAAQQPAAPAEPAPSFLSPPSPPAVGPVSPDVGEDVAARARALQEWITQQTQPQPQQPAPEPATPARTPVPGPVHEPSPPVQTPGTQLGNTPDANGRVFPLAAKPTNTPTATYHSQGGSDLMAPRGTPVLNMQSGKVVDVFTDNGSHTVGGNGVLIRGDDGLDYYYAHFDQPTGLKAGQRVETGVQIGAVGNSGNAWKGGKGETHLHIGIGHGISNGVGSEGGLGQNFNAHQLLDTLQSGIGQSTTAPAGLPPSRFNPGGKTTAEISGGGPSGGMTERAQSIMSEAGQAAGVFGGDAAKAVQAVLVTEGGMNNARGDSGQSAGPLQFYGGGGQLNNFARDLGVPLEDAKRWVEENPIAAVKWALGTPDLPGYLGRALIDGIRQGLQGSALAEHIQRVGQVSVSPERAAANYQSLFGQGQEAVRRAGTGAMDAALEAGREVEGRAGELVREGQQLAQQGQDAWGRLADMQAQTRAEGDRWLTEQRARGEEWDARRQRQDLDWQRSMADQMAQFQENARGFAAPLAQGAETAWDFLSGETARRNQQQAFTPEFQARAREVAEAPPYLPQNVGEAAGAMLRGGGGTSMSIPEWQRLEDKRRRDVSGFVRENVPGGNEPVIGGALQMAAEEVTSPTNIVLAGPLMRLGFGVAALAGGGTRGAIADWAVQGGLFSAITAASKPGATPEDVGQAFLEGAAVGGGIRGAGALAGPIGRRLINSPELQRFIRSESGELDIDRLVGAGRPEDVPTPEPPARRVFHGTANEFDTPDPGRFDPNGLFGPEYYATSDARVSSGYAGRLTPEDIAQSRRIDIDVQRAERGLAEARAAGNADDAAGWTDELAALDDESNQIAGRFAGANIRAVDMPQNLRLFDVDTYADPTAIDAIRTVLPANRAEVFNRQIARAFEGRPMGQQVYDALTAAFGRGTGAKSATNRVLSEAGFDGIRYAGGERIPMQDASGADIKHEAYAIFQESLPKIRNAISGRQGGQATALPAVRAAGALGGGFAGWETAPEEERKPAFNVGPVEVPSGMRVGRAIVGAGAGLATPGIAQAALTRTQLRQDMLERLRSAGIAQAAPQPSRPVGWDVATVADVTKQAILTNPVGRVLDLVGNTIELLRQPAALAMGGQGAEAAAGIGAIMRGLPEALDNALQAIKGHQVGTLGQSAQDIGKSKPIFRVLAAGDIFTRTLGEYQGMASRAVSMLNKAGIEPGTPQAEQYLAQHVDELHREAVRTGTGSVFGSAQRGANASPLDDLMSKLSDVKEGWLKDPSKTKQALGALLDLNIPFSGTPSRVLQIGLERIPGVTQSVGAARVARALQKGDTFAAQKALGEVTVETLIQVRIAQGIADGNITGPDDPEHPSSIQINGEWLPLRMLGVWGITAGIMAAFAESWEKTGREPDPQMTEQFAAALNASMEPLLDAVPGFSMMNMLAAVGRGGFTGAVEQQAQDALNRLLSPALLAQANNKLDPTMRDVHNRGVESLWEPLQAKTPFLSKYLPPKLDPTTGQPITREMTALGGVKKPSSLLTGELARLKREGYELSPPSDKPSSITIRGVPVPVRDGSPEQRAMVAARGQFLAEVSAQLTKPSYAKMSDDQKAKFWSSMIARSARQQTRAWNENVDPERAARILARGKRVVGRLQDVEDETEQTNRQVAIMTQLRRQQQRSA